MYTAALVTMCSHLAGFKRYGWLSEAAVDLALPEGWCLVAVQVLLQLCQADVEVTICEVIPAAVTMQQQQQQCNTSSQHCGSWRNFQPMCQPLTNQRSI
jgi:uncharacterized protein YbdZ (MbtH family)